MRVKPCVGVRAVATHAGDRVTHAGGGVDVTNKVRPDNVYRRTTRFRASNDASPSSARQAGGPQAAVPHSSVPFLKSVMNEWTVAATAVAQPPSTGHAHSTMLTGHSRQSIGSGATERSSLKRERGARLASDHHVHWSDVDISQSQERLDQLLNELKELTISLPNVDRETLARPACHASPIGIVRKDTAGGILADTCKKSIHLPARKRGDGEEGGSLSSATRDPWLHLAADKHLVAPGTNAAASSTSSLAPSFTGGDVQHEATGRTENLSSSVTVATRPRNRPYHTLKDSKPFSYLSRGNMADTFGSGRSLQDGANLFRVAGLESPSLLRKVMAARKEYDYNEGDDNITKFTSSPESYWSSNPIRDSSPEGRTTSRVGPITSKTDHRPLGNKEELKQNITQNVSLTSVDEANNNNDDFWSLGSLKSSSSSYSCVADDNPIEDALTWLERQQRKLQLRRQQAQYGGRRQLDAELRRTLPKTTGFSESDAEGEEQCEVERQFQPRQVDDRGAAGQGETSRLNGQKLPGLTNSQQQQYLEHSYHLPQQQYLQHRHEPLKQQRPDPQRVLLHEPQQEKPNVPVQYPHSYASYSTVGKDGRALYGTLIRQEVNAGYAREAPESSRQPFLSRAAFTRQHADLSSDATWRRTPIQREGDGDTATTDLFGPRSLRGSNASLQSAGTSTASWRGTAVSEMSSRPITPAFPPPSSSGPSTPLPTFRRGHLINDGSSVHGLHLFDSNGRVGSRTTSPSSDLAHLPEKVIGREEPYHRRKRTNSEASDPSSVASGHVKLVRDHTRLWYCPDISREEVVAFLKSRQPGAFIVRDSHSFPGAFGLALRVAKPPVEASDNELVRHFLIEPTPKGVRLKGYANEPVFASLSALVYQHSVTRLALPVRLILPGTGDATPVLASATNCDGGSMSSSSTSMRHLLLQGAACDVTYLITLDTDSLTGPLAVRKAVNSVYSLLDNLNPLVVHFKASAGGITLTDRARRRFFRRHWSPPAISFCSLDPDQRSWTDAEGRRRAIFALVARRQGQGVGGYGDQQCHVFAERDSDQPATAIVSFVKRALLNDLSRQS